MNVKTGKFIFLFFLLLFFFQNVVLAQIIDSEVKSESETGPDQKIPAEDLIKFRDMLIQQQKAARSQPDVRGVRFETGNNPAMGNESAMVVIVQFSDYSCSFCARHSRETFPQIKSEYIETGKIRYVIIDSPLPGHETAIRASEAAHCAYEQDRFWEMHEEMISVPEAMSNPISTAAFTGLDINKFENCMKTNKYADVVSSNILLSSKLNIPSVPGFIIARRSPDNPEEVKGLSYIRGAQPFSHFKEEIDKALAAFDY